MLDSYIVLFFIRSGKEFHAAGPAQEKYVDSRHLGTVAAAERGLISLRRATPTSADARNTHGFRSGRQQVPPPSGRVLKMDELPGYIHPHILYIGVSPLTVV